MLAAESLTKRYGSAPGYDAVRGASLDLRAGEFVSIVGRSGSGKSTLMAMLGALTRPTEGKVLLDGTDIWTLPEAELASVRCARSASSSSSRACFRTSPAVGQCRGSRAARPHRGCTRGLRARLRAARAASGLRDRADAYPGSMSAASSAARSSPAR
jgi:ABC-type glutathione transport system ATPase component